MLLGDKTMIETVKDLIEALTEFNQSATVCIGDNFNNRVELGWSGNEDGSCTKAGCKYVCLDIKGQEEKESI